MIRKSVLAVTGAASILALCVGGQMALADETLSANARWLTSEFESRYTANADLAERIGALHARKEYPSVLLNEMMNSEQMTMEDRDQFTQEIDPIFARTARETSAELKAIVEEIGWEGIRSAGTHLLIMAFDIIIHSDDLSFQRSSMPVFEKLAADDFINPYMFALYYDDVMVQSGELQRYGTQFDCVNGEWVVLPLEDPEAVDQRRAAAGMDPLEEFMNGEISLYGECPASAE